MNIQARKLHLIEEFLHIYDEDLIKKIENFIKNQKKNADNVSVLNESIEEYQTTASQRKKIEIAQNELKTGQSFTQVQIDDEFEKWAEGK
jgi:hypothetical protein